MMRSESARRPWKRKQGGKQVEEGGVMGGGGGGAEGEPGVCHRLMLSH